MKGAEADLWVKLKVKVLEQADAQNRHPLQVMK
jgi:hypothetical protein